MSKFVGGYHTLRPKEDHFSKTMANVDRAVAEYTLNDPKASPMQKAVAMTKISPQGAVQMLKSQAEADEKKQIAQSDAQYMQSRGIAPPSQGGAQQIQQSNQPLASMQQISQRFQPQKLPQAQEKQMPGGLGLTGKQYAPVPQMQEPEVAQPVQKPKDIYDYAMNAPIEDVLKVRSQIQNEDLKKNLDKIIDHKQKQARDETKIRAAEIASGHTAERANKKETLPLRTQYANEAKAAAEIKANQQELMSLVESGNLDDPKLNILAKIIPHEAMKQFLSPETVTYEAIRAANFAEVRNMFKGTTNLKEIEIEDARLASTFLNDMQKKAIIRQRIKAEDAKLLRSEAAAEVEEKHPFIGPIQFQQKVEKLVKPRLEQLAKEYTEETKKILGMRPLSPMNEQDKVLIRKYVTKANGNRDLAKKNLLEDGYRLE